MFHRPNNKTNVLRFELPTSGARPPAAAPVRRLSVLALTGLMVLARPALAEEDPWALCPPPATPWPVPSGVPPAPSADPELVRGWADRAEREADGTAIFTGDVILHQADRQLEAQRARYEPATEDFEAFGEVRLFQDDFTLLGEDARVNLQTLRGDLNAARFHLAERHASGEAERIHLLGEDRTRLDGATYSTCPPQNKAWELQAGEVTLDRATSQGTARNVVLDFKGVPILYTPYLRFPISDERLSGFLFPELGSSDQRGTELSTPYYWNIAPNRDATLTPRYMSRRGLMLDTEFRYLTEASQGEFRGATLPDDSVYGDDRTALSWRHRGQLSPRWRSDIDLNYVSDNDYFDELGNDLDTSSVSHLNRRADLIYSSPDWRFRARAQGFQSLVGREQYRRLPQLTLARRSREHNGELNYGLGGELVRFDNDARAPLGTRLDLSPNVSLPWRNLSGFVVPRLTLRHTQYALDDVAPGEDDAFSRTVPVFSTDAGLFFERRLSFGDTPLTQTLEPRLYYLYKPFREQNDFPLFDTAERDFSYSQMFTEERFSGPDRVADANQLTTGLTTRFLHDETGVELFSAGIGQIQYFEDRDVTLAGEPGTEASSDLIASIAARPHRGLSFVSEVQWNPHDDRTERSLSRFSLRARNGARFSLSHRYRRDLMENAETALLWPVSPRWEVFGRWQYSLEEQATLERLVGVEYKSCCWGLQVMAREYVSNDIDNPDNSILFVLELKGLSSFGDQGQAEDLLERGILGYND